MSNQIVISSGAKVRNLEGVLTGTSGIVDALGINVPDGIPQLDGSGKILVSQLPNSVMEYKGTWNASTNTPTLANGTGNAGDVYLCNVAGTVNFGAGPITFAVGDQVLYSGTTWERASGATGTVTSVAVTESGDALTITGSPITTSGTINIGFAGTTGQYVNGAGGLTTFPSLTGYVPYTGATTNVALGEFGLSGGYIGLDTTPTSTPTSVGTLSWDSSYLTPKVVTGTGNTTLQIGQEEVILIHNNTGSTLTDGQVVYVTGSTGELPSVSLADASSETTSAATLGVITETIANGANGFATVSGIVHGLNTLAFNEGDLLWLSETAGQFTNVKPVSPAHLVLIGYVIKKAGGNGSILVKIQNTQELEECSDVLFTSLANNDILAYESSTDLWKNKTIANVLGYTPANDSLVVHLAGTETITGTKTFSSAIKSEISLTSKSIGTTETLAPSGYVNIQTGGFSGYMTLALSNDTATRNLEFPISGGGKISYELPASSGTIALTSDIPSLSNYVTLSTTQTITGKKTFNPNITPSSALAQGTLFTPTLTATANNDVLIGLDIAPTFTIGAFTGVSRYSARINGSVNIFSSNSSIRIIPNWSPSIKGAWIDLSTEGPSGIGSGGPGANPWVAYAAGAGQWFTNSNIADIAYRNTSGKLLFGNTTGNAGMALVGDNLIIGGVTNAGYKLDVIGTARFSGALSGTSATFSGNVTAAGVIFTSNNTPFATNGSITNHSVVGLVSKATTGSVFDWSIYGTSGNALLVNPTGTDNIAFLTGKFGIGTSSPAVLLDLYKASYPVLQISSGSITGNMGIDTGSSFMNVGTSTNHSLAFATNNTERMRITSGGNVLIGSSVSKADIAGKLQVTGGIHASTGYYSTGVSQAVNALNTNYVIRAGAYSGLIVIRDNTNGGSGVWLADPNMGFIQIANNMPGIFILSYSGGNTVIQKTVGSVPVNLGIAFYSNEFHS